MPSLSTEPHHDKTNKMTVRPAKTLISLGKDSDQPRRPPSPIRVFAVHSMGSQGPSLSSFGQWRLIRLGRCPGWSESSLAAHAILLVLSWGAQSEKSISDFRDVWCTFSFSFYFEQKFLKATLCGIWSGFTLFAKVPNVRHLTLSHLSAHVVNRLARKPEDHPNIFKW